MDFIKVLHKYEGKDTIMVVINRFIKYAHFIALSHPFTAKEVAQIFLDYLYKFHGLPASIVIDKDKIFTSLFLKGFFKKLVVKLLMSSIYDS